MTDAPSCWGVFEVTLKWTLLADITLKPQPPTHLHVSIDKPIDFCVSSTQGKGKMRTYWLQGEKTDVYVIWEAQLPQQKLVDFICSKISPWLKTEEGRSGYIYYLFIVTAKNILKIYCTSCFVWRSFLSSVLFTDEILFFVLSIL